MQDQNPNSKKIIENSIQSEKKEDIIFQELNQNKTERMDPSTSQNKDTDYQIESKGVAFITFLFCGKLLIPRIQYENRIILLGGKVSHDVSKVNIIVVPNSLEFSENKNYLLAIRNKPMLIDETMLCNIIKREEITYVDEAIIYECDEKSYKRLDYLRKIRAKQSINPPKYPNLLVSRRKIYEFSQLCFVLCGRFKSFTQDEYEDKIHKKGAHVSHTGSEANVIVLLDSNKFIESIKYKKAKKNNPFIWDETKLLEFVNTQQNKKGFFIPKECKNLDQQKDIKVIEDIYEKKAMIKDYFKEIDDSIETDWKSVDPLPVFQEYVFIRK